MSSISPATRANTSTNSTAEMALSTATLTALPVALCRMPTADGVSAAKASGTSRQRSPRSSSRRAGSDSVVMDGCSAAAPTKAHDSR